jgi:lysozyme family protein
MDSLVDNFARCFAFTLSEEGGFTNNAADPGNWTGGVVGHGVLRGTKYGISAAAYPGLDIEKISEQDAEDIYRRDYYAPLQGDALKLPVGLVLFDGAVNAGLRRAVVWLQQAVGQSADGVLGSKTLEAVGAADPLVLAREILARRIDFYARLPTWPNFGLGWSRRVIALAGEILR